MRKVYLIAATLILAGLLTISASAQTAPTGVAIAKSGTSASTALVVPDIKVAFVNTEAFKDQKLGIKRYLRVSETMDRETNVLQTEIKKMESRLMEIRGEIDKLSDTGSSRFAEKVAEFQKLDDETKRVVQKNSVAFDKRYRELMEPLFADISKQLGDFAAEHGVALIFDVSKLEPAFLVGIPQDIRARDVTQAFIAQFNSKNP